MTGSRRPLRVGIAGLGTMGLNHLRTLLARRDTIVTGLADTSEDARRHAAARCTGDVRLFTDTEGLVRGTRLDALIVAVPTSGHLAAATVALEAGVAVLLEKPIARTSAEGRVLVELADRTGTTLAVGHLERCNPGVRALAVALSEGVLSRVLSMRALRAGPFPGRHQDVGVAVDLATHDIDIMCQLVGEVPCEVTAVRLHHHDPSREDLVSGSLSFPSGALGSIDANWLSPSKRRELTVLGPEGMLELDYLSQALHLTRPSPGRAPGFLGGFAPTIAGDTSAMTVATGEPLVLQLDAFLAAVRGEAPVVATARDGLIALRIAEALLEAAESGRAVDPLADAQVVRTGSGSR